jgi:hypothetical protein
MSLSYIVHTFFSFESDALIWCQLKTKNDTIYRRTDYTVVVVFWILLLRRVLANLYTDNYQLIHVACPLTGRQVSKRALIVNIVFPYCTYLCDVGRIFSWKFPVDHCSSVSCNFLCLRFFLSLIRIFQLVNKLNSAWYSLMSRWTKSWYSYCWNTRVQNQVWCPR